MSDPFSILVVDDHPSMTKTLVDILSVKGFDVYSAYSGAEAIEILQKHTVHILLTDVRMPDMNGVELCRAARKTNPNLIMMLMTAYAADDIIQQGLAEGIKTVLTKPLDINLLLSLFLAYRRLAAGFS